ncbi:MAG TPA: sigma 54-interacting transcriptional regulator, partial [Puia sp.]
METGERIKNKKIRQADKLLQPGDNHLLREQLDRYEKEKNILLALSSDITKVREKNDLIKILSSTLKDFFEFSHVIIALIDRERNIFFPFLKDPQANPVKDRELFNTLFDSKFPLVDSAFTKLIDADVQSSFLIGEMMNEPGVPGFFKINYEHGMREGLLTLLKEKMETFGFIFIYSATTDSFSDLFRTVLRGIAPHLSNAVSNIIINEEIRQKEYIAETLLSLSNDMVTVRNRTDLLNVINFGLKKLIYFTHDVMTVLNENGRSYHAYLIDPDSRAKKFPEYTEMINLPNPVADGIYDVASHSDRPVVFNMDSFDLASAPLWFRLNYTDGARELMIKILPGAGILRHGIILFSDRLNSFDDQALNIIDRISSQLSTAASNISAYEEIENKEKDKSFLLDFSQEIAAVRSKEDLAIAVQRSVKKISSVKGYVIRLINDDGTTMSPYIFDSTISFRNDPEFLFILSSKLKIKDGFQDKILASDEPIFFNIEEESKNVHAPQYIHFWKRVEFLRMTGTALRTGNKELGVFWMETDKVNIPLLKGICAQLSVAISNVMVNEELTSYKQMLEVENDHLKEQIKTIYDFSDIIGSGPEMQKVYHMMSLVAESNSTVLLSGETGTGKELIARGIHNASLRKDKLMIKVNCAALPANLIESELFGHEKGSFTGAIERRVGKFELANNSTLFLDEIGDMPLETQVKLLRVIQERELERVGGKVSIKVNVRIITATNRNLEEEVKSGRFRSDLYY